MIDVTAFLSDKSAKTEKALSAYLNLWNEAPHTLREAVSYSLFAGGKRLRPALALGAAELICGDDKPAIPAACALEMIHTYSLIHDDLPSMDNDSLRRGKPTNHVQFGEATAILAGDALLTMAFDVLAQSNRIDAVKELAWSAGVAGMVGGQVIDLESENQTLHLDELRRLHAYKTGALIRCAVRLGALLANTDERAMTALTAYGEGIGLAFQIADDILDVVGTEQALGKPIGSDEARHKSTYPALVGLDQSRVLAEEAVASALDALHDFGKEGDTLRALARFIIERKS